MYSNVSASSTGDKEKITLSDEIALNDYLISAIDAYRKKKNVTQAELARRLCCSQPTVSKRLSKSSEKESQVTSSKPLTILELDLYCKALGSTIGGVLYNYDQQLAQNRAVYSTNREKEYFVSGTPLNIPSNEENIPADIRPVFPYGVFAENDTLTNSISNPIFKQWFGSYHCYFYSTLSSENVCFHGILDIPKESENGCCNVSFSFCYDERNDLYKKYYGQLVLSKSTNGAYCTLVNHDDQGEITYLLMTKPGTKTANVCCVVAFALTLSGGKATKHPCIERMIISREELSGRNFELAKAHLLLNDKYIRITEEQFSEFLNSHNTPESFKHRFSKYPKPFDYPLLEEYVCRMAMIPETWVKSLTGFTEQEHQTIIDLMRPFSIAPKNNKIKEKTAENDIFNLFQDIYAKWTVPNSSDEER